MNIYDVRVMEPGSYARHYDIKATNFEVINGVYYFWQNGVLQCTFPACFTIIEEIKEEKS